MYSGIRGYKENKYPPSNKMDSRSLGRSYCSVEELIHNEDDTPVYGEVTDDTWDEAFFSELGPVAKQLNSKDDDIDSIKLCSER